MIPTTVISSICGTNTLPTRATARFYILNSIFSNSESMTSFYLLLQYPIRRYSGLHGARIAVQRSGAGAATQRTLWAIRSAGQCKS